MVSSVNWLPLGYREGCFGDYVMFSAGWYDDLASGKFFFSFQVKLTVSSPLSVPPALLWTGCYTCAVHVVKSCWISLPNSLLTLASSWLGFSKRLWLFPKREKCFRTCEQESNWLVLQSKRWINSKNPYSVLLFLLQSNVTLKLLRWGRRRSVCFMQKKHKSCGADVLSWTDFKIVQNQQKSLETLLLIVSGWNP